MLSVLLERAWWSSAGQRALRTVLVAIYPAILALAGGGHVDWIRTGSVAAIAAALSVATSLWYLPEVDGLVRPWWAAMLDRAVRSFGQVLASGLAVAVVLTDVDWPALLTYAAASALGSVLHAIIAALPEAQPVGVPARDVVAQLDTRGAVVAGMASTLPTGKHVNLFRPAMDLIDPGPDQHT